MTDQLADQMADHVARPPMPPVTGDRGRSPGLLRSTRVMALGTIASRGTGMVSKLLLAWAVGTRVGDPYNVANTIPNIVYEMLLGGILTSVLVPLVVKAAAQDGDDGEAYSQRLLTLVTVVLTIATAVVVVLAPQLSRLYVGTGNQAELHLTTVFARFFLPQIVFYGIGATLGAVLNTRDHFAAPMWAPVLNNVIVIATLVAFFFLPGPRGGLTPATITTAQIWTLGLGTTLGIVAQTVALWPALRRVGFRWRPRFDFRHTGLGEAGRLGGWVLGYVAVNQIGFAYVTHLATAAFPTVSSGGHHVVSHGGYSLYVYAFLIFQLPHAIVAVSVITALLPRMSRHAVAGRHRALAGELSRGIRLSAVVLVPASFGFVALCQPIARLLFAHLQMTDFDAQVIGWTLAAFAVGLLPFSVFQLQLRAFYALRDTRFPALANVVTTAVNVLVAFALFAVLPPTWIVPGLALGYSASYVVGIVVFDRRLSRELGGVDAFRVVRTCVRLTLASIVGAALAYAIAAAVQVPFGTGTLGSALQLAAALPLGTAATLWVARRLHVREIQALTAALRRS